jgi:hypothetical protein
MTKRYVTGWLVVDYTDDDDNPSFTRVWTVPTLLDKVEEAREQQRRITVYELGSCLLDWS